MKFYITFYSALLPCLFLQSFKPTHVRGKKIVVVSIINYLQFTYFYSYKMNNLEI